MAPLIAQVLAATLASFSKLHTHFGKGSIGTFE